MYLSRFLISILHYEMYIKQNRSEEHTSELQSQSNLVCRLLLEKKNVVLELARVVLNVVEVDVREL